MRVARERGAVDGSLTVYYASPLFQDGRKEISRRKYCSFHNTLRCAFIPVAGLQRERVQTKPEHRRDIAVIVLVAVVVVIVVVVASLNS